MKKACLAVCFIAVLVMNSAWTPCLAGSKKDWLAAYNAGDYAAAFKIILPFAEKGDRGAQYNVAVSYAKGLGVPINPSTAAQWYQKAAEQGMSDAQFNTGLCYLEGQAVKKMYSRHFSG